MVPSMGRVGEKKKKNAYGLNIWFRLSRRNFKFVVIYSLFPPNQYSQNFRVHKKMFFSKSAGSSQPAPGGPGGTILQTAFLLIHQVIKGYQLRFGQTSGLIQY